MAPSCFLCESQAPATVQCVQCLRDGMDCYSFFCGRDCFRSHWESHRVFGGSGPGHAAPHLAHHQHHSARPASPDSTSSDGGSSDYSGGSYREQGVSRGAYSQQARGRHQLGSQQCWPEVGYGRPSHQQQVVAAQS